MSNEKKICPECGQEIPVSSMKCRFCGHQFDQPAEPSQPVQSQQQYQQQQQFEQTQYEQFDQQQYQQQQYDQYQQQQQQYQQQQQQQYQQQQQQQYQQQQQQQQYQQQQQQQYEQPNQQQYQQPQQPQPAVASYRGEGISIGQVITEGINIGFSNFVTIFVGALLTLITIWIPYLNVGTVIALQTLPVVLGRKDGQSTSPTFVFDGKYRQYMGEYFTLSGLKSLSLFPAFLFLIIPGIIISLGWSQALYLMIDKEIAPGEALIQSAKITQGYKATIFFTGVVLAILIGIAFGIVMWLLNLIDVGFITFIGVLALIASIIVICTGVNAAIYKGLTK